MRLFLPAVKGYLPRSLIDKKRLTGAFRSAGSQTRTENGLIQILLPIRCAWIRERVIDKERLGIASSKLAEAFRRRYESDRQRCTNEQYDSDRGVYELKSAGRCVDAERVCHSYLQYEQFEEITCKATRRKSAPGSLATLSRSPVMHQG